MDHAESDRICMCASLLKMPLIQGIYPEPTWGWQKGAPKSSLYKYGTEHTATPTILNIVQLIHWIPFIPALILAAQISINGATLQKNCGISGLQVCLLLLNCLHARDLLAAPTRH